MIDAPVQRCFLLSLSVDLHVDSMKRTGERAVEGVTSGILTEGQTVTWAIRYLGKELRHKSIIEVWRPYTFFRDSMVAGPFAFFEHEHHFASMNGGTRVRDELRFAAPMGLVGRISESLFLRRYVRNLLLQRNRYIRRVAESQDWHRYLDGQPAPEEIPSRRAVHGIVPAQVLRRSG